MSKGVLLFVAVWLVICPAVAPAQVTNGTILGTVTDTTGAVMPGVRVIATNLETNFSHDAITDSSGQYSIPFLPVGKYRLEAGGAGFKKFQQTGIVLELNRNARVDPVLDIGTVTETVAVTSDAPLVDTASAAIGRTVNNSEIINLPLVNRNVYSLLNLTPGVESSENSNVFGYPEQRTMINGASNGGAGSVNYFLDGGTNMTGLRNTGNIAPNPDAVQEFRIITNSYGAEFGRFSGGVVDVITKSGTNALHGSLFEFIRNDKLNATTWGALTKAPLRRNQFGGSFGGPVRKDKTFYFGSYSGLRQRQVVFKNTAIVPTPLERLGDFSQSRIKPTDPVTRQPFTGGMIPAGQLDPTAKRILDKYIPAANLPGSFFQTQQPSPLDTDEAQIKIDHALTPSHQFTGSYFYTTGMNVETLAGNLPWSMRQFSWRQQNANASDTWLINPATINQLRLTYVRNFGGRLNLPQISLGDLGSRYQIQGPPSLPQITVTGYFTLGQGIAGPSAGSNFYGLRDILSLTRGRHSLKIGGDFSLEKFVHDTTLNNYGTFSFQGNKTGNALADFLLGVPQTMNQDAPITKINNSWYGGLFIQDDFRIRPRLTLNLGLRYDLQWPMTDPHDRQLTFVPGAQSKVVPSALRGLLFPGDPAVTRGTVRADTNNFAPRIGLAWDPFGNGQTSVRAAFGVFYGSISGNEWNSTADRLPFSARQQFNNVKSLTDPYGSLPGGVSPFPYSYDPKNPKLILPAAVSGASLDFAWPYTYQTNFSVERQVMKDVSVTAAYVGSLGRRLPFGQEVNYPVFGPGATANNVDLRRPYSPGTLASIILVKSIMNNAYHGLQMTAEKRMARTFSFKGYYTFSKSLEGARLQNDTTDGGAQDYNNLAAERGRTDNDRRHNFVASWIWQVDYFQKTNPFVRGVINGWTVSGILIARSGAPFTVTTGRDNNLDGNNNDRPNLVGGPHLDPNRSRSAVTAMWFNTAAFAPNGTGQDGNAGRNILDAPGLKTLDLAVFRDFPMRERTRLQFRAEVTNALNLVNLNSPTATLNSSAFGTIRTARPMREMQLGMRLWF